MLSAFADVTQADGSKKSYYLGHQSVLNRQDPKACANCRRQQEVVAAFPLRVLSEADVARAHFRVEVAQKIEHALPKGFAFKTEVRD